VQRIVHVDGRRVLSCITLARCRRANPTSTFRRLGKDWPTGGCEPPRSTFPAAHYRDCLAALAMTPQAAVIARSGATKQSRREGSGRKSSVWFRQLGYGMDAFVSGYTRPVPKLSWSDGGFLPRGTGPGVSVHADSLQEQEANQGASCSSGSRSGQFWPIAAPWHGLLR
jgi:hypothetical protein